MVEVPRACWDRVEILLQFKRQNKIRKVLPLPLPGSPRYRTWREIPTDKTGNWTVSIIEEMEGRDLYLGELEFSVVEVKPESVRFSGFFWQPRQFQLSCKATCFLSIDYLIQVEAGGFGLPRL
jgi:hypothetical protein